MTSHEPKAGSLHSGRFEELKAYSIRKEQSEEFRKTWISPYYPNLNKTSWNWIMSAVSVREEVTDKIIRTTLGGKDADSRETGAFFAAIKGARRHTDIIGVHLLKSEFTGAGPQYIRTLAAFNTRQSVKYLEAYLDYYLGQPELYFEQSTAIAAIKHLDSLNRTRLLKKHLPRWKEYMSFRNRIGLIAIEQLRVSKDLTPEQVKELMRSVELSDTITTHHIEKQLEIIEKIKRFKL